MQQLLGKQLSKAVASSYGRKAVTGKSSHGSSFTYCIFRQALAANYLSAHITQIAHYCTQSQASHISALLMSLFSAPDNSTVTIKADEPLYRTEIAGYCQLRY